MPFLIAVVLSLTSGFHFDGGCTDKGHPEAEASTIGMCVTPNERLGLSNKGPKLVWDPSFSFSQKFTCAVLSFRCGSFLRPSSLFV